MISLDRPTAGLRKATRNIKTEDIRGLAGCRLASAKSVKRRGIGEFVEHRIGRIRLEFGGNFNCGSARPGRGEREDSTQ